MLNDLDKVISHYLETEKKHKEELKSTGINTDNHIYWNLLFLKEWLEKNDISEKND